MLKNIKTKTWIVAGGIGIIVLLVLSFVSSPKPDTKQGYIALETAPAPAVVVPVVPVTQSIVAASAPAETPLAAAPAVASSVPATVAMIAPVAAAPVVVAPTAKPAPAKAKVAAATPDLDKLLNSLDGYLEK